MAANANTTLAGNAMPNANCASDVMPNAGNAMPNAASMPDTTLATNAASMPDTTPVVAVAKECETSINVPISKLLFDKILAKRGHVKKCSVMYYPNDVRVSADCEIQKKYVKSRHNVMKIVTLPRATGAIPTTTTTTTTTLFVPMTRKLALEYPDKLPQNAHTTKLMIVRYVLYHDRHTNYSVRICVEKHASSRWGGKYVFTAEVEYSESSFRLYHRLHAIEQEFVATIVSLYGDEMCEIDFEQVYSAVRPGDIINVPSRVWSRFSEAKAYSQEDVEATTFKFDGYKGRLVNNGGNNTLFYDDLHNMRVVNCRWFQQFPNLVFQVEIMMSGRKPRSLILTDILGAFIGRCERRNLFMPEPLDVLRFFSTVAATAANVLVDLGDTLGKFRLRLQQPIDVRGGAATSSEPIDARGGAATSSESIDARGGAATCSEPIHVRGGAATCSEPINVRGGVVTSSEPYDGYILTIGNRIFKYKIPTLDVRCVNGCLHLDDTVNAISAKRYNHLEESAIYEVAPQKRGDDFSYAVLRKRVDRDYTSTIKEYTEFDAELKFIRAYKPVQK